MRTIMGNVGTVIKADNGVKRQRRGRLGQKEEDEERDVSTEEVHSHMGDSRKLKLFQWERLQWSFRRFIYRPADKLFSII